jgi:hypothetical protein
LTDNPVSDDIAGLYKLIKDRFHGKEEFSVTFNKNDEFLSALYHSSYRNISIQFYSYPFK